MTSHHDGDEDVPGPTTLEERLSLWKNRATFDQYTDSVVRGVQITDGMANAIRQAHKAASVPYPQVGDEASIPCPHCDGPMVVINVIYDSVVVECPTCSGKKGPTK